MPTALPARLLPRSPVVRAVAVDAVLVLLCWLEGFTNQTAGWNRPFLLSVLALVAVPLRRLSPEAAVVLGVPALGWAQSLLAPLVVLFTLGWRQRRTWLVWSLAAVALVVTVWPQWDPRYLDADLAVLLNDGVTVAGAVALGALRRSRAVERRQRGELEQARAGERASAAASARAEERAHLAREMHDVVAHHVSLIAVQAGALQVTTAEERSRQAATTIRDLAATAVGELRQVLGVLRSGREGDRLQPLHSLVDLPGLAEAGGSAVQLVVDPRLLPASPGAPVEVVAPQAVQGTAYRVVQEGLTNARKHAPGSPVRVEVALTTDGRELVVEVVTEAAAGGRREQPVAGAGLGLLGLQERTTSLGGSVETGATAAGGHRLVARVPLPPT